MKTPQQTIKAIVDAAVNDDYAAAEKIIKELVITSYLDGYMFMVDVGKDVVCGITPKELNPGKYFNDNYLNK